jgi:predicted nucleic acid-binding protein
MNKILIDTNVYSEFKRNNIDVVKKLQEVKYIAISTIVLGEITAGFKLGNREQTNSSELNYFLDTSRVHFLTLDEDTADIYATIFKQLKLNGTPIPANDIWIAASAIQHGLALYSLDKHFANIDKLLLVE